MKREILDIHSSHPLEKNTAIALGFFDGLHLGHMTLINKLKEHKDEVTSLFSFTRDFKSKIKNKDEELILLEDERESLLSSKQVEKEYVLPFTDEIKNTSKEDFISFLRILHPKRIVIGSDFTFGSHGSGKATDLLSLKEDFIDVEILDLYKKDNEKISTSKIISLLKEKKINEANSLLGYPFFIKGEVIHGLHHGTTIGFPTANMDYPPNKVILPTGVYQTYVILDGKKYYSLTNIGSHPTIDELSKEIIETNIIDYHGDLYGKNITVYFVKFIREQVKFNSLNELQKQLNKDLEECKKEIDDNQHPIFILNSNL